MEPQLAARTPFCLMHSHDTYKRNAIGASQEPGKVIKTP
jgi:hypothetical protein